MNKTKIIFFDIDGTLIDMNKKQISTKVLQTLIKLKSNGIKLCIATGRSPTQVPHFSDVEFDAYLTYNGSYSFNKHQVIFSNPLEREDVYTIIENAKRLGRPLSLATKNRLASNGADKDLIEYYAFSGTKIEIADDFNTVAHTEDIYQILLSCRKHEYDIIMKDVKEAKIAAWWDRAVDIVPLNGGKGNAIAKVLDHYHYTKEEAMAFGDGNNDIEMLKAVGKGIAMQNASLELKSIADDICDDVANDGIYSYCKKHGLI